MGERNDGGQAFPSTIKSWNDHTAQDHGGMSLRDWFAGQALAGRLANPSVIDTRADYAADAYKQADAMLRARSATLSPEPTEGAAS